MPRFEDGWAGEMRERLEQFSRREPQAAPFVGPWIESLDARVRGLRRKSLSLVDQAVRALAAAPEPLRHAALRLYLGVFVDTRAGRQAVVFAGGPPPAVFPHPFLENVVRPFLSGLPAEERARWEPFFVREGARDLAAHVVALDPGDQRVRRHGLSSLSRRIDLALHELPDLVLAPPDEFRRMVEDVRWLVAGTEEEARWKARIERWARHAEWWSDYQSKRTTYPTYGEYLDFIGADWE